MLPAGMIKIDAEKSLIQSVCKKRKVFSCLIFIFLSIFVTEFNPLPKGYGKMRGKNT